MRELLSSGPATERASLRTSVLVVAGVAVAIGLSRTSTFTWPARLIVAFVELAAAALVVRSWQKGRPGDPVRLPFARLWAWTMLAAAGAAWELEELFQSPRSAYPTASSLLGAAMAASPWVKAAVVAAWLALGVVLVW